MSNDEKYARGGYIPTPPGGPTLPPGIEPGPPGYVIPNRAVRKFGAELLRRLREGDQWPG